MNALLNWIAGARWRESASHCAEGLLIQIPTALIAQSWWVGALCTVVWYWSRKKLEIEVAASPGNHVSVWADGWFPWQWSWYQVLDVVLPAISSCALAFLLMRYGIRIAWPR
ncbi:hypothetical protein PQR39_35140 [Paraburkholderia sediminicola]|uniref:hypothetical protein n=1 Tax=Paraburkholderia sediminicola TaxID=458836 RepID=UPI0038B71159